MSGLKALDENRLIADRQEAVGRTMSRRQASFMTSSPWEKLRSRTVIDIIARSDYHVPIVMQYSGGTTSPSSLDRQKNQSAAIQGKPAKKKLLHTACASGNLSLYASMDHFLHTLFHFRRKIRTRDGLAVQPKQHRQYRK